MTPLETLWSLDPTDLTTARQVKADAWAAAWADPVTVGSITVTSMVFDPVLDRVAFEGTGPVSWPLRLNGFSVGVVDPAGSEIAPDGTVWRTDPIAVLRGVLESLL